MNNEMKKKIINVLADSLDIPDSEYEAAADRYRDLGEWLHDESKAKSARHNPDIFPQGSFRLGTATRPWKREDYDLDLSCNLQSGITKDEYTQEQLKQLVGSDLNAYREERGIQDKLEEKHRCWRLNYQGKLKFHMDTVPSVPQPEGTRLVIQERMIKAGSDTVLAQNVSQLAVAITDDRHKDYRKISEEWYISNPKGYAIWFESRMRKAQKFLESRAMIENVTKVDDLPTYKWKTPLQRCVQILKRHRDIMFEHSPDRKPISIIITTLAARAYLGELDLQEALENILDKVASLVNPIYPRVPNPVNPPEDFTEKWRTEEGRKLSLEKNFWLWLDQVKNDFDVLTSSRDKNFINEQAMLKFGSRLDEENLSKIVGATSVITSPKSHYITDAPKPWRS